MMNWNALYDRLRAGIPALELRRDEPMARHTTFQVGGPVPVMALPKDEGEAQTVLHIAAMEFGIRPFFMGKGSNLLVSDAGADLLVVKAYDGLGRLELLPGGSGPDIRPSWRAAACPWRGFLISPWSTASPAWSLPMASPAAWGAACT